MNPVISLTQKQLSEFLLSVAIVRPVFIWGPPGIGKSSLVIQFVLSDALKEWGEEISDEMLEPLTFGCLSPHHATQFKGFVKHIRNRYALSSLLKGEMKWPSRPEDRDVLYFMAQSFRAHLVKELPDQRDVQSSPHVKELAHQAKALIKQLASISLEIAQMVVANDTADENIPDWFMVEIVRDLPRIVVK